MTRDQAREEALQFVHRLKISECRLMNKAAYSLHELLSGAWEIRIEIPWDNAPKKKPDGD